MTKLRKIFPAVLGNLENSELLPNMVYCHVSERVILRASLAGLLFAFLLDALCPPLLASEVINREAEAVDSNAIAQHDPFSSVRPKRTPEAAPILVPVIDLLLEGSAESESNITDPTGNGPGETEIEVHTYLKTQGPDKNPLKGWNSGWWNSREEASVGFQYIPWKEFEPKNGQFDYENVEQIIDRPGSRGRHVSLRLYCDWFGESLVSRGCPEWMYTEVGVKRLRGENGRYITDFNDPNFIKEATQAIRALGNRYDDDPRIHSFQIGVLGYWGEWHTFDSRINGETYSIAEETEQKVLSAYRESFKTAKLVARYPNRSVLATATDIGYHNDYFHPNDGHSDDFDAAVEAAEKWRFGPIGGEIPPGLSSADYEKLYQTSKGVSMIRRARYSTMKPGEVEEKHREKHMELHRLMGYNFQIERALFSDSADTSLAITLELTNTGVAPIYYPWQVQFGILDKSDTALVTRDAEPHDLTKLLPGEVFEFQGELSLAEIDSGEHRLAVRIIQPSADALKSERWKLDPVHTYIRFANELPVIKGSWDSKNRLRGGWSVLGDVRVL